MDSSGRGGPGQAAAVPLEKNNRRVVNGQLVKCVAVVGGTHGNERIGVHLIRLIERHPHLAFRESFSTLSLIANTTASEGGRNGGGGGGHVGRRYIEEDLNRCFLVEKLRRDRDDDGAAVSSEQRRAWEIDTVLGPKASPSPVADLVIDLHSTTAATGVLLLMARDDDFAHEVAAHLITLDPSVRVCEWSEGEMPYLPTTGRSGMTFEVGPVPQGCVDPLLFNRTRDLLFSALDYVHLRNRAQEEAAAAATSLDMIVFQKVGAIDYPRDADGELLACVHPDLQGRDFESELRDGDPLFQYFTGESETFSSSSLARMQEEAGEDAPLFGFFINEASYYEKNVALCLARKLRRTIRK